jgi:hypothetical protein
MGRCCLRIWAVYNLRSLNERGTQRARDVAGFFSFLFLFDHLRHTEKSGKKKKRISFIST